MSSRKEPRKHHFVPQCYLRNFAIKRKKSEQVVAFDRVQRKIFTPSIADIAAMRDYNRVQIDGVNPSALEDGFSRYETIIAPILARIAESGNFESDDDKVAILEFVTLLFVRNPRTKRNLNIFINDVNEKILHLMLHSKERWGEQVLKMKADGVQINEDITYEQLKSVVDERRIELSVSNAYTSKLMIDSIKELAPIVMARNWSILRCRQGDAQFITSDHPAQLYWTDPSLMKFPVGLGHAKTELYCPMSSQVALVGSLELQGDVYDLPAFAVASLNSRMLASCESQVYAKTRDFPYLGGKRDTVKSGVDILGDIYFLNRISKQNHQEHAGDVPFRPD